MINSWESFYHKNVQKYDCGMGMIEWEMNAGVDGVDGMIMVVLWVSLMVDDEDWVLFLNIKKTEK